jgi:hypothetical protein
MVRESVVAMGAVHCASQVHIAQISGDKSVAVYIDDENDTSRCKNLNDSFIRVLSFGTVDCNHHFANTANCLNAVGDSVPSVTLHVFGDFQCADVNVEVHGSHSNYLLCLSLFCTLIIIQVQSNKTDLMDKLKKIPYISSRPYVRNAVVEFILLGVDLLRSAFH